MTLFSPFIVDDDTGDFCSIDPTACPQCKRSDAFVESALPRLSEEVVTQDQRAVEELRGQMHKRKRDRLLSRLDANSRMVPHRVVNSRGIMESDAAGHGVLRQINGFAHHVVAVSSVQRSGMATCEFAEYSTVGMPSLYCDESVLYFEVKVMARHSHAAAAVVQPLPLYAPADFKCGFSLLDGLEVSNGHTGVGVGETCKSWGFDSYGNKWNGVVFSDQRFVPHWNHAGCVMGFAVNATKGMIACSINGKWDIVDECGVKFQDESIKSGVYPCISGRGVSLQVRYAPDAFVYSPPPPELWDTWPRYEELNWITMPAEARAAAMVMGYTSTTWAWSGNEIDNKAWEEMTPEEQAAGRVLGYNEKIWTQLTTLWHQHAEDNPDSDSEGDMSLSCFSAMFWSDLPNDAREAAETLGYSKTLWDEDSAIPLGAKWFSQLTSEQRRAAVVLGYDSQSWNEYTESYLTPSVASEENASFVLPFDHLRWDALPMHAREAAEAIGYTKEVWDGNEAGPLDYEPWNELTAEEQEAATVLGYDENTWNDSL